MGDSLPKARLAAVQASSVFLNREGSVEKAARLIRQAGHAGADIIGFPEGFIPAHPIWFHFQPASGRQAMALSRRLFENSLVIPSPETSALAAACREGRITAVIGVCEKEPGTTGTMYNTLLVIDREGTIVGRHRKLMPTLGERIVHAYGGGDTMSAFSTHIGPVGALACGENANPLTAFVLALQSVVVHVAAWPSLFSVGVSMHDAIEARTRGLAQTLRAFVINAVGVVDEDAVEACATSEEDRAALEAAAAMGGASILGPRGDYLAGPMGPGDGILYADVDLGDVIIPKIAMDFGGHYNRFDVFRVFLDPGDGSPIELTSSGVRGGDRVGVPLRPKGQQGDEDSDGQPHGVDTGMAPSHGEASVASKH
jgi:aliphatic nitrilase